MKEEFNQNTNIINQLNIDVHNSDISNEYKKLNGALERLEDVHERRIDAGIDKENKFNPSEHDTVNIIKINEKLNSPTPAESDISSLLDKLNKISLEINELTELKTKYERNRNLLKRKQMLLDSLLLDIEELSAKLRKIQKELDKMKNLMNDMRQEEIEKDRKITIQIETLRTLESKLNELKRKLKELEDMSIEGFTDQDIMDLRELLDKINKEIENIRNKHRKQDEYYSIKKNELLEKEKYIVELRRQLLELGEPEDEPAPIMQTIEVVDELDRMMLDYVREWKWNVPITRMGGGYYLFGTRKIYAKILNGRLVIRVGDGYMIIAEFLEKYSEIELNKIRRLMEKEGISRYSKWRLTQVILKFI